MRKLFLTFVTALLCSIVSFAQDTIQISSAEDFLKIGKDPNYPVNRPYKQTADINLGTYHATDNNFIIESFSGNFNGDNHTITYQGSFTSTRDGETIGLFETVSGTIQNLNLNADITVSGTNAQVKVGLLCGELANSGTIKFCDVTGNVNSTAKSGSTGNASTGLIIGNNFGDLQYCTGHGNVTGVGYVGGLVGSMGNIIENCPNRSTPSIKGCYFTGNVTANNSSSLNWASDYIQVQSYGGGICGTMRAPAVIELCVAEAIIVVGQNAAGITTTTIGNGLFGTGNCGTAQNNYATGTINGNQITSSNLVHHGLPYITSSPTNSNNPNHTTNSTTNSTTNLQTIVDALNIKRGSDNNFYFAVINGKIVLVVGQQETILVCEAPSGLSITENEGLHTATWTMSGTDNSINETKFHYELSGGVYDTPQSGTITGNSVSTESPLSPSPIPYVFTVKADCRANQADLYSDEISQSFMVECPKPTNLSVSNVSYKGFSVNYSATAKSKLTVASREWVIENTGNLTQQIPELLPQTEYTATVSVLCDEEYVESLSTTVTTSAVPAPTSLSAVAVWQETAGMVTISWSGEDDLTYEIDGEGVKESGFEKEGLDVGNYTARVRARYQNPNNSEDFYYSDWSEIAYTVSNPPAPSNPQISFAHQGDGTADVTITWIAGSDDSPTWIIKEGETQLATGLSSATYTISGRNVGSSFTIKISEKTTPGTSEPLLVNVTVPCADATLPEPESIETNQTTATFTFDSEQTDRKIVIGGTEYDASSASVTLSNLSSGTNYNYTIREYCTATLYSEKSSTFVTKSCYAVTGLQAQATGVTSGSASWTTQGELSGLNYKVRLLQGANEISSTEQTETSITFSGLQPSTTYTVKVSEQCGDAYGDVRTISFTTESSTFITKQSGNFNDPNTWTNKKVPQGNVAYITIAPGHKLKLSGDLKITDTYKIVSNQGVLEIPAGKQLINTTDENVGGIIEVSTPQKTVDQWTFIGAPFKSGYKLGSIKPVSGSDVAMVEYDYTAGKWSDYFVNYLTTMSAAEGAFAWMFYNGVVTFSTYDLGQNGTSYPDNAVADYVLNNADVTVTETLRNSESSPGYWMALANPYPAKLSVSEFLGDNTLQGNCVYVFRNGTFDMDAGTNGTQGLSSGNIEMTEGFFVNFGSAGSHTANFNKEQLTNYPSSSSKSTNASSEFIELTLVNGKDKVRVYFAQNEDAEQGYDILDANKMFATTGVAEPYFVTDGIALIKEEVRDLPYYATMNVRSQEDTVMNFVLTNLPEGYAVSIIDGEEVIDLVEGGVYSTEIASGENADRFKVLVKKNVGLADVEELDVRITNSNRHITITAQENVRTEVYNTLGQKVFETEDTNFVLSGVASGAYVVKVQGAKASKSQKIVVE